MLKYSHSFTIKNNDKDSGTPVRLRISFQGSRPELYTGIIVKPSEWNKEHQLVNNLKDPRNKEINKIESIIEEIFKEFEVIKKRYPTAEELKQQFALKTGKASAAKKKESLLFTEVINEYIKEKRKSKQWTPGTEGKYDKLRNHITAYNPLLITDDINEKEIRELMDYFASAPKDFKTGEIKEAHRNTTIRRNISDYLRILQWASKKGMYSGNAFNEFEQRFKGTQQKLSELVYLEWDELMALMEKDFGVKKYLNRVRDVFCFCCFSSLRFSDVSKLKKTDIRGNYFLVETEKTSDPLSIDLNNFSKSILDKYKNEEFPGGLALPVISMTKTNEYLKEIGGIMEYDTPIKDVYYIGNKKYEDVYLKKDVLSTHAGRRTFVINSLRLGIPAEVIIKWTGHKDYNALRPYIKIVDDLKRSEMDKFNVTPKFTPSIKHNNTEQ